jgi:serine/threonine protein phosphatase PrpC
LKAANLAIAKAAANAPAFEGMGCTLVAMLVLGNQMWWVSVGDSNLYLIRGDKLVRKNLQHNFSIIAELMVKQGKSIEAFGKLSPRTLMSALTGRDIPYVDCPPKPFTLLPKDWVIVSTDGMDSAADPTVLECVQQARDAKSCVAGIIRVVEEVGVPQQDNTTLVVARLTEDATEASMGADEGSGTVAGSKLPTMPDEFDL